MENLEMVKFDENGQAYIDFEALEVITSSQFIEFMKENIKVDFSYSLHSGKSFKYHFVSAEFDNLVKVFVSSDGFLAVYTYMHDGEREYNIKSFIASSDIRQAVREGLI